MNNTRPTRLRKADREPLPEQRYRPARSDEEIAELLQQLESNHGEWFVYSEHTSRGSARQRVLALKNSQSFKDLPLAWRTMREIEGDPSSKVQVLVRWEPKAQPS